MFAKGKGVPFLAAQLYLHAYLSLDLDLNALDLKRLDLLGIRKRLCMDKKVFV